MLDCTWLKVSSYLFPTELLILPYDIHYSLSARPQTGVRNEFGCPVHTLLDTTQHLAIRSVVSCHVDNDKKSQDSHGDTVKLRSLSSLPQGPLCRPCLQERFVAAISPCMVYFPTFEFGKYTGPMDPMGFQSPCLSARAMCIAMTGKTRTKGCHLPKCQSYPKLVSCSSKYLATKFVSKHMFQADSYYMLLSYQVDFDTESTITLNSIQVI